MLNGPAATHYSSQLCCPPMFLLPRYASSLWKLISPPIALAALALKIPKFVHAWLVYLCLLPLSEIAMRHVWIPFLSLMIRVPEQCSLIEIWRLPFFDVPRQILMLDFCERQPLLCCLRQQKGRDFCEQVSLKLHLSPLSDRQRQSL